MVLIVGRSDDHPFRVNCKGSELSAASRLRDCFALVCLMQKYAPIAMPPRKAAPPRLRPRMRPKLLLLSEKRLKYIFCLRSYANSPFLVVDSKDMVVGGRVDVVSEVYSASKHLSIHFWSSFSRASEKSWMYSRSDKVWNSLALPIPHCVSKAVISMMLTSFATIGVGVIIVFVLVDSPIWSISALDRSIISPSLNSCSFSFVWKLM